MKPHEYMKEIFLAFKKRDGKKLRKLNESILREASLVYSKKFYWLAVIAYVLSKILGKPRFMERKYYEHMNRMQSDLEKLANCQAECTEEEFQQHFTKLVSSIKSIEAQDQRFLTDLLTKGKLKVAATLYAQGISLGTASEITGIEKQEILSYAGHTMMFDRIREERGLKDRMAALRRLLEG
ncbi:MAG: hypothetical protein WC488_05150 [Candidatus Micrarchaeia archaeon]